MAFEKLDHTNLSKKVVRAIRHQIFSGVLKADERVVESEIARALGISRGPVREALVELEREGLIGKLYDKFYTTTGVASIVAVMEKLGQRIAEELKAEGVSGVILTST